MLSVGVACDAHDKVVMSSEGPLDPRQSSVAPESNGDGFLVIDGLAGGLASLIAGGLASLLA